MYGKASEPRTIMVATVQAGLRPRSGPRRVDVLVRVRRRVRHGRASAAEGQRPAGTPVAAVAQPAVAGGVEVVRRAGWLPRPALGEATSARSVRVVPLTRDGPSSASVPWLGLGRPPASIADILWCISLAVGQVLRLAAMSRSTPSAWWSAGQTDGAAAAFGWVPGIVPLHRLMPAAGARRRVGVMGEGFCAGAAWRGRRGKPRGWACPVRPGRGCPGRPRSLEASGDDRRQAGGARLRRHPAA